MNWIKSIVPLFSERRWILFIFGFINIVVFHIAYDLPVPCFPHVSGCVRDQYDIAVELVREGEMNVLEPLTVYDREKVLSRFLNSPLYVYISSGLGSLLRDVPAAGGQRRGRGEPKRHRCCQGDGIQAD